MTTYNDPDVIYGSSRVTYNGSAVDTEGTGTPPLAVASTVAPRIVASTVKPANVAVAPRPRSVTAAPRPR